MRVGIISVLLAMTCASIAQAGDLVASSPLEGLSNQTLGVCNFYNTGNTTLQLSALHIVGQGGGYLPLTGNNCSSSGLLARRSCAISATVYFLPYACIATVSPNKTNFRGVFEMEDSTGNHVGRTTTLR